MFFFDLRLEATDWVGGAIGKSNGKKPIMTSNSSGEETLFDFGIECIVCWVEVDVSSLGKGPSLRRYASDGSMGVFGSDLHMFWFTFLWVELKESDDWVTLVGLYSENDGVKYSLWFFNYDT